MSQYTNYYHNGVCIAAVNGDAMETRNVVYSDRNNGAYETWRIEDVRLTTNGEFSCVAVCNNGRMVERITGQFVIMALTIMAHIARRMTK